MSLCNCFARLVGSFGLIVLASDLLYLYFTGAWHEPTLVFLIAELVALPLLVILGFYNIYVAGLAIVHYRMEEKKKEEKW